MPKVLKTKLRCKECESKDLEILEVKQGKNQGRKYAVCDNGCTSLNKQTGRRGKKWVGWVDPEPEEEESEPEEKPPPPKKRKAPSPPPAPAPAPTKKQKKQQADTEEEEESEGETLELDRNTILLEELKNGQRQLQDEIKTVGNRLLLVYSKLPTASQWPKPQQESNSPADGIQPSQKTPQQMLSTTLFTLDGSK